MTITSFTILSAPRPRTQVARAPWSRTVVASRKQTGFGFTGKLRPSVSSCHVLSPSEKLVLSSLLLPASDK